MTTLLKTYLICLVFWYIVVYVMYLLKSWNYAFPLGSLTQSKILVFYVTPFLSFLTVVIIGLIQCLFYNNSQSAFFLIASITILGGIMIFLFIYSLVVNKIEKINRKGVSDKIAECNDWIKILHLAPDKKIEIDVYTASHKSVGRLVIYNLNTEELEKVREAKKTLPKDISLWFV